MKDFKDKVIVITGGSSGIGKEIGLEAARRGMKVVINGMTPSRVDATVEQIKGMGVDCIGQAADISQEETVKDLLKLTLDNFGQVDILVNNAGISVSGPIWEVPTQDMDWILDLNLRSHLWGMHYFIPQMIKQGTECAIINTESTAGLMTSGNAIMYHTTKHAGVAASECAYQSLKIRGLERIMVHCLVPAFAKTEIHKPEARRPARFSDTSDAYYQSQEFKSGALRSQKGVEGGIEVDYIGYCVFNAIEEKRFWIFTSPESQVVAGMRVKNMMDGNNPQ